MKVIQCISGVSESLNLGFKTCSVAVFLLCRHSVSRFVEQSLCIFKLKWLFTKIYLRMHDDVSISDFYTSVFNI